MPAIALYLAKFGTPAIHKSDFAELRPLPKILEWL
jgi:hypothetical protein